MNIVKNRWDHGGAIKIEWNLGKRCNYDCSYCPSSIHDNTSPHTDIEILKVAVDRLATLNKPIRLSFTGGEPTVHPKFKELLTYCRTKGINWISVTTNGTLPYEFYINLPVDQIVFSVHFEYNWERVTDTLVKVAALTAISVTAQLMAHHDLMTEVKTCYDRLLSNNTPVTLRRIRWTEGDHDLFDDMRYEHDDLNWILSTDATIKPNTILINDTVEEILHANDIIKLHKNQYTGWTCNAGLESLMINWDGDVHRATCRVGGSLGNIYNNTLITPTEPIICDRKFCTCASDIPIFKKK